MTGWKKGISILFLGIIATGLVIMTRPFIFGETAKGFLFIRMAEPGMAVTLSYRHSVMKTPIEEYLVVNDAADGFTLKGTRYQSQGVGLPFLASEGKFREEGGWFYLTDMNRSYPTLSIRNGVSNNGVLTVGDTKYVLPDLMPLGSELHMYVCPLYKGLLMKKSFH